MSPTALATFSSLRLRAPLPFSPCRSGSPLPAGTALGEDLDGALARPASSRSKTTRTLCTFPVSPILPNVSVTRPDRGDAMVTVALSVITSTIGSSSAIVCPGSTCHATISPSVTPSPMSGSLNSKRDMRVSSVPGRFYDGRQDAVRKGQVFHFQSIGERRVETGHPDGRRLEIEERLFVDERDDLASKAAR